MRKIKSNPNEINGVLVLYIQDENKQYYLSYERNEDKLLELEEINSDIVKDKADELRNLNYEYCSSLKYSYNII